MDIASATNPDFLFSICSGLAMLGWLALAVSPHGAAWAPVARKVAGQAIPLVLALVYVWLFAAKGMGDGGYDSLAAVRRLFAVPELLLAGWVHYLAFDLFVGAWIADRAGELRLPHVLVLPLLALTFMFGPAGLLAFALVRAFRSRGRPAPLPA